MTVPIDKASHPELAPMSPPVAIHQKSHSIDLATLRRSGDNSSSLQTDSHAMGTSGIYSSGPAFICFYCGQVSQRLPTGRHRCPKQQPQIPPRAAHNANNNYGYGIINPMAPQYVPQWMPANGPPLKPKATVLPIDEATREAAQGLLSLKLPSQ
jgi:hypothetical protein